MYEFQPMSKLPFIYRTLVNCFLTMSTRLLCWGAYWAWTPYLIGQELLWTSSLANQSKRFCWRKALIETFEWQNSQWSLANETQSSYIELTEAKLKASMGSIGQNVYLIP